jgi:hypothetical protein
LLRWPITRRCARPDVTSHTRGIVVRSLFFSAFLFAGFGASTLSGLVTIEESSRSTLAICLLLVAASDVIIAFFLLTRS